MENQFSKAFDTEMEQFFAASFGPSKELVDNNEYLLDIRFNIIEKYRNAPFSDRCGVVYASLRKKDSDELTISAELNYILKASEERGYKIVNLQQQLAVLVSSPYNKLGIL